MKTHAGAARRVREVKTHAAARRVGSEDTRRGVREVKTHAAARRVESEDTPLRGVWEVMSRRPLRGRQSPHMVISLRHAGWGRRTHRNGTRPAHDLQGMGRQACWRSNIAYLARWR